MRDQPDIMRHTMPPRLKLFGIGLLCLVGAVLAAGIASRIYAGHNVQRWTSDQSVLTVQTIGLKNVKGGGDFTLPGDVQAFSSAPIYARVSGYVKKWYVDIGAHVTAGQLLAELDTPDLDAQLSQSKANLASAVADQKLSAATAKRWDELLIQGAVAHQDADAKDSDLAAKNAAVAAARAAVQNLEANESFKRLTAPFDGIVTSRAVDVGTLVSVGSASATPLFTVADQQKLRIYVRVPQAYSALIQPGMTAKFNVPEYPGRNFTATLAGTADAMQSASGTQLVQFAIDNKDGALKPGSYAEMHLTTPAGGGIVRVPASALLFRDEGMMVATVDKNSRIVLKRITIRRDFGNAVEVGTGISAKDRVINNPPDSISAGDLVKVSDAPPAVATN